MKGKESAQKMFFLFQKYSTPSACYLCRHFGNVENYCAEKVQLLHCLCDSDSHYIFSSFPPILQSSNIIFPFSDFFHLTFLWLCSKARHDEMDKAELCKRGEKIVPHRSESRQTWAVLLWNIQLMTTAFCYITFLSQCGWIILEIPK